MSNDFENRIILFIGGRPNRKSSRGEITQRIGRRVNQKTRVKSLNSLVKAGLLEHRYGVPLGRGPGRPIHQYAMTKAGERQYRRLLSRIAAGEV